MPLHDKTNKMNSKDMELPGHIYPVIPKVLYSISPCCLNLMFSRKYGKVARLVHWFR